MFMRAQVSGLCAQPVLMRMHAPFMCTRALLCVHIRVLSSYRCMIQPAYVFRDLAYAYADLHVHAGTQKALFSLFCIIFHLFPYPNVIFMLSFHIFCRSCLRSRVGEVLIALLCGIGP